MVMAGNTSEAGLEDADVSDAAAGRESPVAAHRNRQRGRQWNVTAAVAAGGVVGAELRYGLADAVPHSASGFPWSTVYINSLGCVLLGVLMVVLSQLTSPHRLLRPFLGIGILGGFTTFSTFTVDTERLIEHHRAGVAGAYVLVTLVVAAVAMGASTAVAQVMVQLVAKARRRRAEESRLRAGEPANDHSRGRP
jgi:CrcB protein